MSSRCGFNPFNWFQPQTITKDNKTYHVETVSTKLANDIAQTNFDQKVEEVNKRYANSAKRATPKDSQYGE